MVNRELLLQLAISEHARKIFKTISERQNIHYNELCRSVNFPKATVNKYLNLLEEANILECLPLKIEVSEAYALKGQNVHRVRRSWVTVWKVKESKEAREFASIIEWMNEKG
jgi:predicted AAA+ superfamily ATPase